MLIAEIAERILEEYESVTLVDKYDAYEVLLSYWTEVMSDEVYILVQDGYKAIRDVEVFKKEKGRYGNKTGEKKWAGMASSFQKTLL